MKNYLKSLILHRGTTLDNHGCEFKYKCYSTNCGIDSEKLNFGASVEKATIWERHYHFDSTHDDLSRKLQATTLRGLKNLVSNWGKEV